MIPLLARLVLYCAVLGFGVALLLSAALGSDGYSTFINGVSIATGLPFWTVNLAVGAALIALAWARGVRPGWGTVVQPVVVGVTVSVAMSVLEEPETLLARSAFLALSLVVVAVGVAGYLAVDAGAGPTEAAAMALDPPLPFAWSYGLVQGGGALVGWLCGAAVGVGTVLVIALLGPLVELATRLLGWRERRAAAPGGTQH